MDNIRLDFEQAKAKHLMFKSKLRSILYGAHIDETPVLSHFECAVGKWIYGHALKEYGHIQEVNELEKVHENIHTAARDLVALYKEGKVEEAIFGLNRVEQIADRLIELLDIVKEKVEASGTNSSSSGEYQSREVSMQELIDLTKANEELDRIIKQQSAEIIRHRNLLYESLMQLPANVSIMRGPDHVIEFMNDTARKANKKPNVIGKPVRVAYPEVEGQGYFELLDQVYTTGENFVGKEMPIKVDRGNGLELLYSNISYHQLKDIEGKPEGILAFSYEVTELVLARKKLEELVQQVQQSYEDLEVKVKFRNLELEKENLDLKERLLQLTQEG